MIGNTAIIGLTGGIASGKSSVSRLLAAHGIPIVDADEIARKIVEPGQPALGEIVDVFGPEVLADDGSLLRERLGEIIFANPDARRKLNSLMHPRISQETARQLSALASEGAPLVVYDAALIIENRLHQGFDLLVVVDVEKEQQIERLMERNGLSQGDAEQRLAAQMPAKEKVALADLVVDNRGSYQDLPAEVERLFAELSNRFGPTVVGSNPPERSAQ